jgi:hypothetical protein
VHTADMSRRWVLGLTALALVAAGLVAAGLIRRTHETNRAERGALTPHEYAVALLWARSQLTHVDGRLSGAVAIVGADPHAKCSASKRVVQVDLMGPSLGVNVGTGGRGRDTWVVIEVDPVTNEVCASGASTGHFPSPPDSANLLPALS